MDNEALKGSELKTAARRPAMVLNVNDAEGARYTTSLMLRKAGFAVLEAASGAAALELAEELPEVIVLDVRLPDIDGFEVCRRIRANPRTASIKNPAHLRHFRHAGEARAGA
ncbi:MAG: response regulator [Myxococcales bacterium]